MAKIEILLPAMGEGITEATITKWLVAEGDRVEEDDSIVEIATDKVDSEIPAPEDGVIEKLLFAEGDVPQVGDLLAILKTDGEEDDDSAETPAEKEEKPAKEEKEEPADTEKEEVSEKVDEKPEQSEKIPGISEIEKQSEQTRDLPPASVGDKFLSPLVRSIIEKEKITEEELHTIEGTGKDGRITKNDMLNYLNSGRKAATPEAATKPESKPEPKKPAAVQVTAASGDEIIEMDRMRRLIADHMVKSKHTSPHVTSFHEVDVTNLVTWRNKVKDEFLKREDEKLTFTPIFFEAAAKTLKDLPRVNVSVDGYNIIVRKNINIGMATALPSGNLIVPVIKNADEKNLLGLAKAVNDLAQRARENKLQPDEIQGGTFTITNFGTFGNLTGAPIINQPEAAILGLGTISKKPAVIETPQGDAIAIRHKMILSLAYDHRVVDGALGGLFLKTMADYLENFDVNRSI